jgi:hypothetical protein
VVTDSKPYAPRGLGRRGRQLWHDVLAQYELDARELAILEQACRAADRVERLETELAGAPSVVPGSKEQPVAHPLWMALRAQVDTLGRLLDKLKPEAEKPAAPVAPLARREQARRAAAARWNRPGPARAVQ